MTATTKKKFGFYIPAFVVLAAGIAMVGYEMLLHNSVPFGEPCRDSSHCTKPANTCISLDGSERICTKICTGPDSCPTGYACREIQVTLNDSDGVHNMGTMHYCYPSKSKSK